MRFTKLRSGSYQAVGIDYTKSGTIYSVNAAREVILSTGTVHTPQILELSGIGNKTLLNSLGITNLIDLPTVGENLQDHTSVPATFLLKQPSPITLGKNDCRNQ